MESCPYCELGLGKGWRYLSHYLHMNTRGVHAFFNYIFYSPHGCLEEEVQNDEENWNTCSSTPKGNVAPPNPHMLLEDSRRRALSGIKRSSC